MSTMGKYPRSTYPRHGVGGNMPASRAGSKKPSDGERGEAPRLSSISSLTGVTAGAVTPGNTTGRAAARCVGTMSRSMVISLLRSWAVAVAAAATTHPSESICRSFIAVGVWLVLRFITFSRVGRVISTDGCQSSGRCRLPRRDNCRAANGGIRQPRMIHPVRA